MPRENDAYRDHLEEIKKHFVAKRVLSISDVARYTGLDRKTVVRRYGITKNGVSVEKLARLLNMH